MANDGPSPESPDTTPSKKGNAGDDLSTSHKVLGCITTIAILALLAGGGWFVFGQCDWDSSSDLACRQDVQCWGEKHHLDAENLCPRLVEGWARFDYEWTDGFTDWKFDNWVWQDRPAGIIRYMGNNVKFQNGFGAWQRMHYMCDYNTETGNARVVQVVPNN